MPAAPSGLTATAISTTRIDLAWTDNSNNEDAFEIYRSTDGTTYTFLATAAADATSYSNTGLTSDTIYYYKVRSRYAGGTTVSSFTTAANATALPTPAAFTAEIGSTWVSGAGTSTVVTVVGAHSGHAVVMIGFEGDAFGDPGFVSSVVDSRGNTYAQRFDMNQFLVGRVICFSAPLTTALQDGDTITVTHTSAAQRAVLAFSASSIRATPADKTATNTASGVTSLSSGTTAATTQADEFLVGGFMVLDSVFGEALTPTGGWTQRTAVQLSVGLSGTTRTLFTLHKVVSAIGTQEATATIPSSSSYVGAIVTLKAGN